jgi:hypothetical protein
MVPHKNRRICREMDLDWAHRETTTPLYGGQKKFGIDKTGTTLKIHEQKPKI